MATNIVGVGLLLFSDGRLLAVQELQSKPQYHKLAGMISFPLETFDGEKDRTTTDTIIRLLSEELGISNDEVDLWGIAPETFKLIPGRNDVETHYGVGTFLGNPERKFHPSDNDIRVVGWKTPDQLLNEKSIRVEVRPILEDFSKRKKEDFY